LSLNRGGCAEPALPRHQQDVQNQNTSKHNGRAEDKTTHGCSGSSPVSDRNKDGSGDNNPRLNESAERQALISKEIYWCVDRPWTEPNETLLSTLINSEAIRDDAELYKKLKIEYIKTRGWFRHYLLSWKTCTSVDFVKVSCSI
jgi:hypothetical protein